MVKTFRSNVDTLCDGHLDHLMFFWFHPRREHYSIDALSKRHVRERNEAALFFVEGEVVGLKQAWKFLNFFPPAFF